MVTLNRLKEVLYYDPSSGIFTYKVNRGTAKIGNVAGNLSKAGYRYLSIDNVTYAEHRLAWLYIYEKWPDNDIDHINRIKNDNRILNLRDISKKQNNLNKEFKLSSNYLYRGIRKTTGSLGYSAELQGMYLGTYSTQEEASIVYENTAKKEYKEFYQDPGYSYCKDIIPIRHALGNRKVISSTGYTGVYPYGKRFQAAITINKKKVRLGVYNTPEEASKVFQGKKKEISISKLE